MKNYFSTTLVFFFLISNLSFSQKLSTKDSITTFYSHLLDSIQAKYLNSEKVNWKQVKVSTIENAIRANSFEESLNQIIKLFDTIDCNHCELFTDKGSYKSTLNKPLSQDDFSMEFLLKLEKKPSFEVKLINENIGYVIIPGMLMIDLSQNALNIETQKMYDEIAQLAKKNELNGWIIDLRFNIGGNVYPMLAALHSLLGDNIVYNTVDKNGSVILPHRLKNGGFYSGKKLETEAKISVSPNLSVPVAIITGKMTGSAGEDIAVAFKNRTNVIFIGEKSYGLLTGNDLIDFPFNLKLALTTSYISDINNKYEPYITPDVEIIKKDNFEDLLKDQNIIRAIEFFESKRD